MKKFFTAIVLGVFSACLISGCADTQTADSTTDDTAEHDHDHEGHSHDHDGHDHGDHDGHDHSGDDVHGPFGGHTFRFDSDDYRAEWKHYNDNNVIRVYVLDPTGKKEAPVKASVAMFPMAGSDKTPFELEAEKPNESGESAVYALDDQNLGIAITAGGVKVEMKTGGKTYTGIIDAHAPHDH